MPRLLTALEIRKELRDLDGWKAQGKFITKTFEFGGFMEGIGFLNDIAKVAENREHHPDINVRYTTVRLSVQTHSEGGVTSRDIGLARAIDRVSRTRRSKTKKQHDV